MFPYELCPGLTAIKGDGDALICLDMRPAPYYKYIPIDWDEWIREGK